MIYNNINSKEFFRSFVIFFGMIVVFFFVLFGIIKMTSTRPAEELKKSVQALLDEKYDGEWIVQESKDVSSPFKLSSSIFLIENSKTHQHSYAVLLRIATLYGPYPAVFIYNQGKKTVFVGYTSVQGRIKNLLEYDNSNNRIRYWLEKVPEIVENSVESENF